MIRVPAAEHEARFAAATPLPIVEPVARRELPSREQSDGVADVELELGDDSGSLRLVELELRAPGRLRGRLSSAARPTRGAGARHRATGP